MTTTKTVSIEAPIGLVDERVFVLNYRKRPCEWEHGTIRESKYRLTYHQKATDGSWNYEVVLDRRSEKGNLIFLYVSGDSIKRIG